MPILQINPIGSIWCFRKRRFFFFPHNNHDTMNKVMALRFFLALSFALSMFFAKPTSAAPRLNCTDIKSVTTEDETRLNKINDLYLDYYRRNARCDELKTHFEKKTKLSKLRKHFRKTITGWFSNLTASPLKNRTVAVDNNWYVVKRDGVFRIPDWPTGLAWGLTLDSRFVLPKDLVAQWRKATGEVALLPFTSGPYATMIRDVWWNDATPSTILPVKVRNELTRLRDRGVFIETTYQPERQDDPFVKYFDWSWMKANPVNFTVAFFGDQGLNNESVRVLQLISDEGADMAVHLGDFEYTNNPDAWDMMIESVLPPTFPYFALVGNHDLEAWDGYAAVLADRREGFDGELCSGEVGVKEVCTFRGLRFLLSGVGTKGTDHETFLRTELAKPFDGWTICAWHKNQQLMQVGGKTDEVGWDAYEACREAGAIIATAHEHSYSRTYLMSDFRNQRVVHTESTMTLKPGETFAFVSGLGGNSIRNQDAELYLNPWWASIYTADQNANYGALFCTFNYQGDARRAHCYFKDIDGRVPDQFDVLR